MSARDRETAVAIARAAASLDGAVLGLGTAALAVVSLVKYLSASKALRRLAAAPSVTIPDLRSILAGADGESRVAAVRGFVRAAPRGRVLVTAGSGEHCVIAKHTQMCLYNEWRGIFGWTFDLHDIFFRSLKEQIKQSSRSVPFVLVDSKYGDYIGMVHVKLDGATQPLPLTTAYHKLVPIEPNPYTLFQTIIGSGYPTALLDEERILPIGKEITAVGFCRANKGSVEISSCTEIPFFLSELTKDEMEAELALRAKTLFWTSVVLGTISVSLLGYAIYRHWKRFIEWWKARADQSLFHQATDDAREDGSSDDEHGEVGDGQLCVICLSRRRKAAFIPCGHLVCCCTCALNIQRDHEPLCPLCHQDVQHMIKIFNS